MQTQQIRSENWEIVTGCERITAGCDNCPSYLEYKSNGWSYNATFQSEHIDAPLANPLPTRYMVAFGSDLFHEAVTPDHLVEVFDVMKRCERHYFEICTKRAERCSYVSNELRLDYGKNISIAFAVESARQKWRMEYLREINAIVRIVSMAPLIGEMGILDLHGISFVGVQPETWGDKRECKQEWIDDIKKQCEEQGVVFIIDQPVYNGRVA